MRTRSKLLPILLSLVLAASMCPTMALAKGDLAVSTDSGLSTQAASDHTADDAINWAKSKVGTPVGYDDGSGYFQCVEFIQAYYQYLGVPAVSGNGCDYASNALPAGWTRTAGGQPQKGDILVYGAYGSQAYGHVAIYESDGSLYDQDGSVWGATVKHEAANYRTYTWAYWGCIHPNFGGGYAVPTANAPIADGTYTIVSAMDAGKCLDVAGGGKANGTNLELYSRHGGTNQQFRITKQGYGPYRLQSVCDDLYVDNGGGTAVGDNTHMWQWASTRAQNWWITDAGDGYYHITCDLTGLRLDVAFESTADGANIQTCTPNNGANQKFRLVKVAADISGATITGIANKTYTGKALTQSPTVKLGSTTLASGTDYTLSYKDNVTAGTATVTVSGQGDYTGTKSITFKIEPASISGAEVSGISAKTYNGEPITQTPTVRLGGTTLTAGADYDISYKDNVKVGTATVTLTGKGNYTGTKDVTFEINAAPSSPSTPSSPTMSKASIAKATVGGLKAKTYTGKALAQSPTVRLGSATLKAGVDYAVSYRNNVNAGTATMTINGEGAYAGTKVVTFAINKADVKNATAAKVKAQKYRKGKAIKPSPKLTYRGTTLKKGADYTLSYKDNRKRGTATITVKGKGNFKGTKTVKFKIV